MDTRMNPYSPATDTGDAASDRYGLLFAAAFWLTGSIAVLVAAVPLYLAYINYLAMRDSGGSLPTYILLVTVLMICCSAGFSFSAIQWRRRNTRLAVISFLIAMATVVVGPYVLLMLLYGSP